MAELRVRRPSKSSVSGRHSYLPHTRAHVCSTSSSSSEDHRPQNYADEYTRARKAVAARDQAYGDVSVDIYIISGIDFLLKPGETWGRSCLRCRARTRQRRWSTRARRSSRHIITIGRR